MNEEYVYLNQSTKWENDEAPGSDDGPVAGHALPLLEAAAYGDAEGEQDDSTEDSCKQINVSDTRGGNEPSRFTIFAKVRFQLYLLQTE